MTLLQHAGLERLDLTQMIQEIQQNGIASMAKIKAQIEDNLNMSKLSDSEKLVILHRSDDRYDKIQEIIWPKI